MGPAQTYIHLFNSILFTLFLESNGPLSLQNPLKRNPNNHILSPQKEIKKIEENRNPHNPILEEIEN